LYSYVGGGVAVGVVWHDPGVIQREVWAGTVIVAVSVAFSIFSLYSTAVKRGWLRGVKRYVVLLGGWTVLFTIQLSYLSSHYIIVYGVLYNETTSSFSYTTVENPMWFPVLAVTVSTAVVAIGSFLIGLIYDYYSKMARSIRRVYIEA
jgi:hypothetical protein